MSTSPTSRTYNGLDGAYSFFNQRLFSGTLPDCLITLQRKNGAYGYFSGDRFATPDGSDLTDEIALNPKHFRRASEACLSTLVHEMVHLRQYHSGKPSRTGYHNKEWASMMSEVGLIASDTGAPGGRQVGQKVSHYVETGGAFEVACAELLSSGFDTLLVDLSSYDNARVKKAASKTRYTCVTCLAKAWAKPGTKLTCGDCDAEIIHKSDGAIRRSCLQNEATARRPIG